MVRPIIFSAAALLAATASAVGAPPTRGHDQMSFLTGPGIGDLECPGDVNEDDRVDVDDLILVILAYGSIGDVPSDVNGDGFVDIFDLLTVIENWGPCPD